MKNPLSAMLVYSRDNYIAYIHNLPDCVTLVGSWVDRDLIRKSNLIIKNLCISQIGSYLYILTLG